MSKNKKITIISLTIIVIIAISSIFILNKNSSVKSIQNGYLTEYSTSTAINSVLDSQFTSSNWVDIGKDENGNITVKYSGELSNDNYIIFFTLKENKISISELFKNNISLSESDINDFMNQLFNN